jgi:60 kDa SS-A/Ro ribonucleoprotein
MTNYAQHFSTLTTPQNEAARSDQVQNSAGGFVFQLDKWKRLDRWLILGAEGGTYYASERKLTRDNAQTILECLAEDGARAIRTIVEISDAGRAPKNDPAIFALALAASDAKLETRQAALAALPRVCRIGTHLFHFAQAVSVNRGWSRGLRAAFANWYTSKTPEKLAYDVLKYQQRDGWSHRDVIRLAHPSMCSPEHNAIFRWVCEGIQSEPVRHVKRKSTTGERTVEYRSEMAPPALLVSYEELKAEKDPAAVAKLIRDHGFTHEMVPSDQKSTAVVWEALFEQMPMTAMIRNLGKMTSVGLFSPMGARTRQAAERLTDAEQLKNARVHPLALLSAMRVYQQGHGEKGSLTWEPAREIVDALDEAFYLTFQAIEPTNKRWLLALDVSGSMTWSTIAGCPGITPRDGSAAMSLVTARTETAWHCIGFSHTMEPIGISPKQRLDDVIQTIEHVRPGNTYCSLPMLYAEQNKIPVDVFTVYTDSETWCGEIHPFQALKQYRQKMGIGAKLIVVGMTATGFTISDPSDAGMMDVVGFDTAAPAVMSDFAKQT